MILVTYDIMDDKKRTRFSKFLEKFGERVQYSVFSIRNSKRILAILLNEIKFRYEKQFDKCDSIYIFQICGSCTNNIVRYGSPKHEEEGLVYFN
jgi:CRISPR-associated protein Cas2